MDHPDRLSDTLRGGFVPDPGPVYHLSGDLDLTAAAALPARVAEIVDGGGIELILDMTEVVSMDSTGLAILLGLHRDLERWGSRLAIRGMSQPAGRLLELSGMPDFFTVV